MSLPLSSLLIQLLPIRMKMNDGHSINTLLPQSLEQIPREDWPTAKAILYSTIRRTAENRFIISELANKQPNAQVQALLECALGTLELNGVKSFTVGNETVKAAKSDENLRHSAGFVNAILRNYGRRKAELEAKMSGQRTCRWNAPSWWIQAIAEAHPQDWERILSVALEHPPLTLRVNTARISMSDYAAMLSSAGMSHRQVGLEAFELTTPVSVDKIPGFWEGLCSVQDAGAQLAGQLLPVKDGDRVLDACAAPGGKTTHLLEKAAVQMTALEVDAVRAGRIQENLDRLGLKADIIHADANEVSKWWDGKPFDAILLDAPCTASGVVRRQPDTPWIRRKGDVAMLAAQQRELLESLWPLVKAGGHLLYVTCSIFPEEGPLQMEAFLKKHSDATVVPLCRSNHGMMILLPQDSEKPSTELIPAVNDGFFYTLFKKEVA